MATNIIDRPLSKGTKQVSHSAFAFIFAEAIQYFQHRIDNVGDLERKLEDLGHSVGWRMLDLIAARKKLSHREIKIVNILQFISSTCWKNLFGRAADALERSTENEDEYHIHDKDPITNRFISVPKDLGRLNCAAYIAGIIRGLLCASGFEASVTAHLMNAQGSTPESPSFKTIYLIKFTQQVMEREKA